MKNVEYRDLFYTVSYIKLALNTAYKIVRLLHKVTDVEGWFNVDTDLFLLELEILLQHNVLGKYLTEFWEEYSSKYIFER